MTGGPLHVVVPDRPAEAPSGGDRYDAAIVGRWRHLGREVNQVRAEGDWPWPSEAQRTALDVRLDALGPGAVLVDGLVGCAAPGAVRRSAQARPTALLVHSLLADGAGESGERAAELDRRERRALAAAHLVVTVSDWAREELRARHGVGDVVVARPGTERAPVAEGSRGGSAEHHSAPLLLALGAVAPVKNHAVLLAALEEVADLPWTAVLAGPAQDPVHLDTLVADARARGIADRVAWPGTVEGEELERLWQRTDLLVHPSRSETWAQVVAEAHAHGIPTVVGEGTGAVEALRGTGCDDPPGVAVPVEGPEELAGALRRWLTEPDLREAWRAAALERRALLSGWDRTVRQIDLALDRIER
ncbi:glycosyltransferase family 4 protein [Ornithinimicrobium avium]|uniref:Glycosyltransferase n=1 Tax=Ornithinimicrobium avium TaxID=2283195 RepID=A0A345NPF4_9MICO|nr:glycosyltransferase family 4 protein [Ornithinimicrobium avium]AXH96912.1 glycosyltransferase [Ornithinimicrobium avium]